jgi:predicted dehydrogenase
MAPKIRVGVVGTSWWADRMHLPALVSHPGAAPVALCGRDRARAQTLATKYAIPHVYTDYREMIARESLHALIVSVPDDAHYDVTMAALDAGLHVLCEKPLAYTLAQARAITEQAESVRVQTMTYFTWRGVPHFRYIKRLIDEGFIGRVYHCQFIQFGGYARDSQYLWRFDARRANGALGDLGSHMIDLAHWLVGDIVRVSAHLTTAVARANIAQPANDAAALLAQFANGAQGMIHVSAVAYQGARGQQQILRLHGDQGTLEADYTQTDSEIRGLRHDEPAFRVLPIPDDILQGVNPHNQYEVFMRQSQGARAFIDAIIEDKPITPSFADGLKAQAVIAAALEAHERKCWADVV